MQQYAALERHYRVIAIDQRGHGNSPVPEQPYDPVKDIRAALETLDADPVAVIGLEDGADLALRVAAHAARPPALVLAAPAVGWLGLETLEPGPALDAVADELLQQLLADDANQPLVDAVSAHDEYRIAQMLGDDPEALAEGHPARELLRAMAQTNAGAVFRGDLIAGPDAICAYGSAN